MKKIYDISLPISVQTIVYPGDPPVKIQQITDVSKGDLTNISELNLNTHTATHVDAPRHLFNNAQGVDQISLDSLVGPAAVYEYRNLSQIDIEHIQGLPIKSGDRILFKTDNSFLYRENKFNTNFTCLSPQAARYLAAVGVKLIGIDYFSVDPFNETLEAHWILLEKGIIILEGINLHNVTPGKYELICLPLKIKDGDGAPARVILRDL